MNKGFTLIELLVVIVVIAVLASVVSLNLISFQKDASLNGFAKEFASVLKTARNRSLNGEVPAGVTGFEDYDETDTLPFWVVNVSGAKYSIFSKYKKAADPGFTQSTEEETTIPSGNSITPITEISFERLTGKTTPVSFIVSVDGHSDIRKVAVDELGNVTVTK